MLSYATNQHSLSKVENERPDISSKLLLYLLGVTVGIVSYLTNTTIITNKENISDNKRYSEDTRAALYHEIIPIREQVVKSASQIEALKGDNNDLKERIARIEGHEDVHKP